MLLLFLFSQVTYCGLYFLVTYILLTCVAFSLGFIQGCGGFHFFLCCINLLDTKTNVVSEIEVTDLEACEVISQVSYMQVV